VREQLFVCINLGQKNEGTGTGLKAFLPPIDSGHKIIVERLRVFPHPARNSTLISFQQILVTKSSRC